MTEFDDLPGRLAAFGRHPVPDDVARRHLAMIEAAPVAVPARASRRGQTWSRKIAVGGAFLGGLLTGGMGLAAAGALPRPAQNVAHSALHAVGVEVPKSPARSTDGCDSATVKNHGQFVSSQPTGDRSAAAQSNCGKPESSVHPAASTTPTTAVHGDSDVKGNDDNASSPTTEAKDDIAKTDNASSPGKSGESHGNSDAAHAAHGPTSTSSSSTSSSTTVVHGNGKGNNGNGNGNGGGSKEKSNPNAHGGNG